MSLPLISAPGTQCLVSYGLSLEFEECGEIPVAAKEEASLGHPLGCGLRSQGLLSGLLLSHNLSHLPFFSDDGASEALCDQSKETTSKSTLSGFSVPSMVSAFLTAGLGVFMWGCDYAVIIGKTGQRGAVW